MVKKKDTMVAGVAEGDVGRMSFTICFCLSGIETNYHALGGLFVISFVTLI
jgi:hypothetical protein